ncbi:META domain-containing protein [Pedobacter nyackensis]|uniref:META domain-containing protein n=1 Tax=Pedobacter nyackensis TaxID=475255 RepID=UPI00292EC3F6|nr:META domain-containing protein [Pedobacter nyackensis]
MKKIITLILIAISTLTACNTMKKGQSSEKLTGNWELNYITGVRIAFNGLYPDTKPSLNFKAPFKEVSGNSSCNGFSTKLEVNGNKMTVSQPIAITMRHCEGEGEQRFMDMLKKVTAYSIEGNTLTLLQDDIAVMKFTKK